MNAPVKSRSKNEAIETVRGLACLMLVLYHVIGGTPESGLRINDGFWRIANDTLAYIRMPLFTFLSGMVYAYRPVDDLSWPFFKEKLRRLLVPMLFVGTLFFLIQGHSPDTNKAGATSLSLMHIVPVGHFWFIEALLSIFFLIMLLERYKVLGSWLGCLLAVGASALLVVLSNLLPAHLNYFAVDGLFYLMPFFLSGVATYRYGPSAASPVSKYYVLAPFALLLVGILSGQGVTAPGTKSLFAVVVGITGCLFVLKHMPIVPHLAFIGGYSYAIYLHHVFFTAAGRIILMRYQVTDIYILMSSGLALGIAGPILMERYLGHVPVLRTLLFGKK